MNFIKILSLMFHFPFLVKLETRIGSFQSDSNYFEDVLPLNEGAYLSPMLNCKLFKCAINCMAIALCDAFLFNPLTSDCWILRCPLNGLKVVPRSRWMYYHRPNGCDVGWSRFESHCYLYSETTVSWQDAKLFCESQGAYLLEVDSQKEIDWVTEKLLKTDVCSNPRLCSTWSGGSKTTMSGFLWQHSNSPLTYINWNPPEPNGDGKRINMRHHGGWNDAPCTYRFKFICEKSLR